MIRTIFALTTLFLACGPTEDDMAVPPGRILRGGAMLAQEDRRTSAALATLIADIDPRIAPLPYTFDVVASSYFTTPTVDPGTVYFARIKNMAADIPVGSIIVFSGTAVGPATQKGIAVYEYAIGATGKKTLTLIPESVFFVSDTNPFVLATYSTPFTLIKSKAYVIGVVSDQAILDNAAVLAPTLLAPAIKTNNVFVNAASGFPQGFQLKNPDSSGNPVGSIAQSGLIFGALVFPVGNNATTLQVY